MRVDFKGGAPRCAFFLYVGFFALAACNPKDDTRAVTVPAEKPAAETVPAQTPAETAPAPKPAAVQNITIDTVEIANPLVVRGTARTFENNVVLRARAADGKIITETFTTATGEMGQHSPYTASLWLTRDPGTNVVIEALEYSAKDGSETNNVSVRKPFAMQTVDAVLYFPDENCTGVKPYTRPVPKSVSLARLLVEALVAGPTEDERKRGASMPFPDGSRVQSVILRDGIVTVDFNERLQSVGGACRTQMIRDSVTATLKRLPSIRDVIITAGGSRELALQP